MWLIAHILRFLIIYIVIMSNVDRSRRENMDAICGEDKSADVDTDDSGFVEGKTYPIAAAAFRAVIGDGWGRRPDAAEQEENRRVAEEYGRRLRNASSGEREAYRRLLREHEETVARERFEYRNSMRRERAEREANQHGRSLARREP